MAEAMDRPPGHIPAPKPGSGPGGLTIDLWCNPVAGGWEPADLESGLGGGEEALILWGAALARRGHRIRIYHNQRLAPGGREFGGALFLPRERFDPFEQRDVLVSWKSAHPWRIGASAGACIHWSSDVEHPWPHQWARRVRAFVAMSPFHRQSMPWLEADQVRIIPLGIDPAQLEEERVEKLPGRAIYCSSPDRGLATLLRDWPRLRELHPGLTLEVFYGWERLVACGRGSPEVLRFKGELEKMLEQPGIRYRGQVTRKEMARAYWEAEYWLLPLNRAESELFCLNAVKAMYCGAVGVIHRLGALRDTVTRWIDYGEFLEGAETVRRGGTVHPVGWDEIIADYWEPLFKELRCNS